MRNRTVEGDAIDAMYDIQAMAGLALLHIDNGDSELARKELYEVNEKCMKVLERFEKEAMDDCAC